MNLPTGNLDTLRSRVTLLLDEIAQDSTDRGAQDTRNHDADLPTLTRAYEQLFDVMQRLEADKLAAVNTPAPQPDPAGDITEIGEYALGLQESLGALIPGADPGEHQLDLAINTMDVALWIGRHGGKIDTLEPVVDALAVIANSTRDIEKLAALNRLVTRIIDAVSPLIREDLERINPGRPWRVLLLNHGIIATRSHNPVLMEAAFALLTEHLPEDAARFFTEGMQQMDALNYPDQVREVMQRYHRRWTVNRSLH